MWFVREVKRLHCCRTYSFLALVVLLRCPPEQLQQQGQDILTKFSDLVVKCLIKLTKALQNTLDVGLVDFDQM